MSKPATSAVQQGIHHQEKGRYAQAKKCYEKALKERPDNVSALVNLGVTLHQLRQTKKGLEYIDKALALQPKHGDILYNKAELLRQSKDYEAALPYYQQVAQLQKPTGMHLYHMGCCFEAMRRDEEALLCYTQAFELKQDSRFACQAGDLLLQRGEIPIARACYENAVKYDKQNAKAYLGLAITYKRENEALERQYLEQALQADPRDIKVRASLFFSKLNLCDWTHYHTERAALTRILQETLKKQESTITGYDCMVLQVSSDLRYQVAKTSIPTIERMTQYANRSYTFKPYHHTRLRVGYVSSDFNHHPLAQLIKNLFYYHNRETVEVYLYSHGINDGSEYRQHIEATAEHFLDCRQWSDVAIADKIYQDEIDILIDLNGPTTQNRLSVFALRPAPLQVTYLGYPGTTGGSFMDYIIGDDTIIPEKDLACYAEKLIAMPDTYMCTDNQQTIAPRPTRSEHGLPEDAFVLCTFNSPYKLDPTVFESWVNILKQCDNAVLWFYVRHEETKKNLRAYAEKLGLDASRLIFADHEINKAKHLARLSLSNLFLDAFAVGAHTTCVDALWVGVPLVTCEGDTFVQRGASSILKAIDLPELITTNKKDYEDKIIQLVKNPDLYAALHQKLLQNQKTTPLFDTARFARHLEKAYELIWQRHEEGLAPAPIHVPKES